MGPASAVHTISGLHPLFHLAAVSSVIALALRGELYLRVVLLGAYLLYISDNAIGGPQPDWSNLFWNSLFFLINFYAMGRIVADRTTFGLNPEERQVFETLISLTPGQFRHLSRIADWRVAEETRLITTEGVVPDSLFYVYKGTIEVLKGERSITLDPGTFIGEIAFLRGVPATASVVVEPGTRYVEWSVSRLRRHLTRHNPLRLAFNRMLSDDLAIKLARS